MNYQFFGNIEGELLGQKVCFCGGWEWALTIYHSEMIQCLQKCICSHQQCNFGKFETFLIY